ncbi:MAG TPA: tetratricopeptide repeat protein [Candidatus Limnocylindrales bacterium]|nr:tetratricopeptide repeat protein [Candidatus Limnocylindrales bacterium]
MLVISLALLMVTIAAGTANAQPQSTDSLSPAIAALYHSGSYDAAADQLRARLARNANDALSNYWLGRCLFEMDDFDGAISALKRAVALEPGSSEYHQWLGRAYGRKAEKSSGFAALSVAKKCKKEFDLAVQLDPQNIKAQRDLIEFIADAPSDLGGGEERGLEQIQALSALDELQGRLALADFHAERKKYAQSDAEYQAILESSPETTDAWLEIADYFRGRGNATRIAQAVAGAENADASDRRLSYYRGTALVLANRDFDAAEKFLQTYIDTVPENSELPSHSSAYAYLGKLSENRSQPERAIQQYTKALELNHDNRMAKQRLKALQKH